jgi:hypothetical protein
MAAAMHAAVGCNDGARNFWLMDMCEPEFLPAFGPESILPTDSLACFHFISVLIVAQAGETWDLALRTFSSAPALSVFLTPPSLG